MHVSWRSKDRPLSHELLATLEHTLASSGREYYILQMFEYTGVAAPILGLPASGEFEGFLALAAYFGLRHELEYRLKCVGSEQQRREFLLYFGLVGLGVWKSTDSLDVPISRYTGVNSGRRRRSKPGLLVVCERRNLWRMLDNVDSLSEHGSRAPRVTI